MARRRLELAASQIFATDILTDLSLKELAPALGLSHQRVHQIVEAGGDDRSGGLPPQ